MLRRWASLTDSKSASLAWSSCIVAPTPCVSVWQKGRRPCRLTCVAQVDALGSLVSQGKRASKASKPEPHHHTQAHRIIISHPFQHKQHSAPTHTTQKPWRTTTPHPRAPRPRSSPHAPCKSSAWARPKKIIPSTSSKPTSTASWPKSPPK